MSDDRRPCAGCGVEVWWVLHERTGKPAPLVTPTDGMPANIVVVEQEGGCVYHILKKIESIGDRVEGYVNHFSNCPKAADFKRR